MLLVYGHLDQQKSVLFINALFVEVPKRQKSYLGNSLIRVSAYGAGGRGSNNGMLY
jgi:hypothetical protein